MREGETRTEGAGTAGKGRQIGVESGTDVGGEERTTEVAEYRAGDVGTSVGTRRGRHLKLIRQLRL